MSNKGTIPGLFYDEEKKRYFAIPNSRSVADFNSPEIRKLHQQIHTTKRRKIESSGFNKIEYEIEKVIILQQQTEEELQKLFKYTDIQGVINPQIQRIFDELTPLPNKTRPIQYASLVANYSIFTRISDLDGFFILIAGRFPNLREPKILMRHRNSDGISEIDTDLDLSFKSTENFDDLRLCKISSYKRHENLSIVPACNNSMCLINTTILKNRRPFMCFDDHLFITKQSNTQADLLMIDPQTLSESKMRLKIRSELLTATNFDNLCCFGYRNGMIEIFDVENPQKQILFDFGTVPCAVALMASGNSLSCVVSGINNNLRSYELDLKAGKAIISKVFNDYRWGLRVSCNIKLDPFLPNIFAIESEHTDIKSLQIHFYSLLCDKPLVMTHGPFKIPNCNTSQHLWNIWNKNIIIYEQQNFSLKVYR